MVIGNGGKLNVIKVKITQLVLYYCVLIIIAIVLIKMKLLHSIAFNLFTYCQ